MAAPVSEFPISGAGTAGKVTGATNAWTVIPATTSMVGMYVTLDPAAANDGYGTFDSSSAVTVFPIVFKAGITQYIPCSKDVPLYFCSKTAANDLHYIAVKQ